MFTEEQEGTKLVDLARPVPDVHLGYVAAGNRGVVGGLRGALCQILKDNILDGEFIVGDSIRAISQRSDGVKVEFTKNTPREFDLVIGADGLHSNVREIVFGEEARFIRDLVYICASIRFPTI